MGILPIGGGSQVEAALGTGCGDATGTPTFTDAVITAPAGTNWKPSPGRWIGGTVMLTGKVGGVLKTAINDTITASDSNTITVTADKWKPSAPSTLLAGVSSLTYSVTAKQDACLATESDGIKNIFGCKQIGDQGYCGGPCRNSDAATVCQTTIGTSLGWVASTCTAANDASGKPGVCVELPANQLSKGPQSGTALLDIVDATTNWVFAIFIVLSIIFVLLAAFQFVTAGGQAEKVGEARQKLIWAAVGIMIALLAKGIVPVVKSIVGG